MQSILSGVKYNLILNFIAKIFSFLRYFIFAYFIGFSAETDAYFLAFSIITFWEAFFGVLDYILVPFLVKNREKNKKLELYELKILKYSILTAIGVIIVYYFSSRIIVEYLFKNLSLLKKNLVLHYLKLGILFVGFNYISSILKIFFRVRRNFKIFSLSESIYSVSITFIILIYLFNKSLNINYFFYSFIISAFFRFLFLIFQYLKTLNFKLFKNNIDADANINFKYMKLLISKDLKVLLFVALIGKFITLTDKFFATFLPDKMLSALNFGVMLLSSIAMIFKIDSIIYISINENDFGWEKLFKYLKGTIVLILPVLIFISIYSKNIIALIFKYGAFKSLEVDYVRRVVRTYIFYTFFGYVANILTKVLQRINKFDRLIIGSIMFFILNAVLDYIFIFKFGLTLGALGIASSISMGLVVLYYLYLINSAMKEFNLVDIIFNFVKYFTLFSILVISLKLLQVSLVKAFIIYFIVYLFMIKRYLKFYA